MSIKYITFLLFLSFLVSFLWGHIISTPDFVIQFIYGVHVVLICAIVLFIMKKLRFAKKVESKKMKYLSIFIVLLIVILFHLIISLF